MNAEENIYRLWAKTNDLEVDYTPEDWNYHPLPLHLLDVGNVAESWLDIDTLLLDRFCDLLPGEKREDVRRLLVLVAALHDTGKIFPLFQAKSKKGWTSGYGTILGEQCPDGRGFDHGAATAALMNRFIRNGLKPEYRPLRGLLFASASHHGLLFGKEITESIPPLNGIPEQMALALIAEVEYFFGPMPTLERRPGNGFCMLAAGFFSVADWVGSDIGTYPFASEISSRKDAKKYLGRLRDTRTAEQALLQTGFITEFLTEVPDFASFFNFSEVLPLQRATDKIPFGIDPGPEIVIVEGPMGGGKTEIAQYLTAQALSHRTAAGLYFALPTQASANALFKRTLAFTKNVSAGVPVALALVHGARNFFDAFKSLIEHSTYIPFTRNVTTSRDEPAPPSEIVATSWLLQSRRALLAPIGIGTIDQAMLGALSVRHAFVRLFALGRKVVVFDEIHAYDAYMNRIIFRLMEWLHVLGAKVILLSATLPDGLRRELLASFDSTEPGKKGDYAPYPQILHAQAGDKALRYLPLSSASANVSKTVEIQLEAVEDALTYGVERVVSLAEQGGCVAWIRNTVREAQEAYRLLLSRTDAHVVLLHARFTRADRNSIEEDLVARLGKDHDPRRPRPESLIVIATQVIEQSVDLDFDVMVSDLAPADLLLQRSGRLHRHVRTDATRQGHTTPVLVVLMPESEARKELQYGTSAFVYDPETLARTAALLENPLNRTWTMPGVCRTLVSELYDHDEDYWTAERLKCLREQLDAVRARARRIKNRMEYDAMKGQMPATDTGSLSMHNVRRDTSDDGAHLLLSTRYGGRSATISLFRNTDDRLRPLGKDVSLPGEKYGFSERLAVEEAFALSSVSFPWYQALPGPDPVEELKPWSAWWNRRHPYDARIYAVIQADDSFTVAEADLHGHYTRFEGLVIDRSNNIIPAKTEDSRDDPPYEAL